MILFATLVAYSEIGICIWGLSRWWPLESGGQALAVGTMWLALLLVWLAVAPWVFWRF